ncbi:MAG: type VI secretion system membrane subunit TssM [Gammaproteobacteria bacterium]
MKAFISFFKRKWVIEAIGIAIFAVLIWFVGPLIGIAGHVPLETEFSRGVTIAIVVLFWLVYRLTYWLVSRKREQQLIDDLSGGAENKPASPSESPTSSEQEVLQRGFDDALTLLKNTAHKQGRRQYIYELPWYAIIGAPGSGKTTALINSGLQFPLAERLGKHAVKGVSGTRDCDWWFTDEAILLDTAGRYTTQDSHQQIDASAWLSFLQLLKKYRPRRPLNGVFIAISIADLLTQTEEEQRRHAGAIRQRIMELNGQLGVQLPVYVLFTKTDLVAGFNDFFSSLTEDERNQVWGETFAASIDPNILAGNLEQCSSGYDELLERLLQRRFRRMQEERDGHRRALVFDFPQQMRLLKPVAMQFLQSIFSVNRFEEPFLLRGVYFTSGTQEGTPIDRILSALMSSFRLDRQATPLLSGRGKSFFLGKLLKQVVFPEADLVGVDPKAERRFRIINLSAYIATFAIVAFAVTAWFVSFTINKMALSDVETQIERYKAPSPVPSDSRGNFVMLLPKLNALLEIENIYQSTGWPATFGLYQGDKVEGGANISYERILRESFVPAVTQRLKERMQGEEGQNLDVLYQLLRVYLMFAEPKRMDAKVAQPWIRQDWERQFATDPETQAKLQLHLDRLLALQLDAAPVDQNFVNAVRNKLTQIPLINQVYSRFKTEALFDHEHDLSLDAQLAPYGNRVFISATGTGLDSMIIPGLFTGYGYGELFLKKGLSYIKEATEQNWVLGTQASTNLIEIDRLYGDFKRLYLADYQKTWEHLVTSVKLRSPQGNAELVDMLDLLSRPDSPLKLLLELIEKHTSLSKISAGIADALAKTQTGAAFVNPESSTQKLLAVAKASDSSVDPVKVLEAYFEPYNQKVRALADRPAPIDATLVSLKNLHDYLMQIGSAPNSSGQALSTETARFAGGGIDPIQAAKMEFARLPGPIAATLNNLTSTGSEQIKNDAKEQLNNVLKTAVTMPCNSALSKRYPFNRSPQDVLMADFAKVFAASGIIDQYFNTNLKAFVDTTTVVWTEFKSDKALDLSPVTIKQFQLAAKIRDAFFPAGSTIPQVQFELKPVALDTRIGTFRLNLEGQELVYRHGPEQLTKFQWPGINSSAGVRVVFEALDGGQVSRSKDGAWAMFRLFDDFNIEPTSLPDRFFLNIQIDGYTARLELRAASVNNPFGISDYQSFRCPEAL